MADVGLVERPNGSDVVEANAEHYGADVFRAESGWKISAMIASKLTQKKVGA